MPRVRGGDGNGNHAFEDLACAAVEGLALGSYRFDTYKTGNSKTTILREATITGVDGSTLKAGIRRALVACDATCWARDLVNTGPSDTTPLFLAQQARKLAGGPIRVKIYDRAKCRAMGMEAFLCVSRGSNQPPALIHLVYKPKGRLRGKIAFVGKGVTFDSGGLSLKTAGGMETMKSDMAGGAAVLGVFRALQSLKFPMEIHGVIAATENMPGGSAVKPGDIVSTMNGKTIEVLNTDAEGRLTLADALAFAQKQGCKEIVDLATLTGACVIALGRAVDTMGNNQQFTDRVIDASKRAGERLWQLPLYDDYREMIRSNVADIKNIGGRAAGAITAGLFLSEFVKRGVKWVHLDIAGAAFVDKSIPESPKGGTGAGVRTLLELAAMTSARN